MIELSHPPMIVAGSIWDILQSSTAFGLFIIILLALLSVISWAVIAAKWREFAAVKRDSDAFLQLFRTSRRLDEMAGPARAAQKSPYAAIFSAGYREWSELSGTQKSGPIPGNTAQLTEVDVEVVEMTMERVMTEQLSKLERGVVVLATVATASPFLGLLGTVVGIMDSFWSIGERGSASLAVVAPGIAEALLATIVGLGAAIPAVIAYNWANNRLKQLHDGAYGFILEVLSRIRRAERG